MFDRVLDRKRAQVLGNPDVPHSVTYIEDFARALVTLGENDDALGEIIALAALRNPTLKAVREQLYQHQNPWVVDSSKFDKAFGWQATPLPDAIEATVAWFSTKR